MRRRAHGEVWKKKACPRLRWMREAGAMNLLVNGRDGMEDGHMPRVQTGRTFEVLTERDVETEMRAVKGGRYAVDIGAGVEG